MEFDMCLDTTYHISHMGLSIASAWNIKVTMEEAAKIEDEDGKFARATLTLAEDVGKVQGKPGQSPKSIAELLMAIECYIITWRYFCQRMAIIRKWSAN